MAYSVFDDVDKKPKDLLKKGYAKGRKIKTDKKTANGIGWKTETTLGDKVSSKVTGKFSTEFVNVDKVEIGSCGTVSVELSNSSIVEGLSTTVKACCSSKGADSGSISSEYNHDAFTFDFDLDIMEKSGSAGILTGYESFLIGAGCGFAPAGLTDYNVALAYKNSDSIFCAKTSNKLSTVAFNVKHDVDPSVSLAANVTLPLKDGAISFGVGGKWVVDSSSTFQAKINEKGVSTLSYIQNLSKGVDATLTTDVNTNTLVSQGISFELSFK